MDIEADRIDCVLVYKLDRLSRSLLDFVKLIELFEQHHVSFVSASIREIALALGVDNSYIARLLRLSLLAPDIVEAILEGTEPSGLSLEKMYRAPMDWERQRQALGIA